MPQSSPLKAEDRQSQFRLRTFLLLILIGGVVLGWLGRNFFTASWRSFMVKRERKAAGVGFDKAFRGSQFGIFCNDAGTNARLVFRNPSALKDADLAHLEDLSTLGYTLEDLILREAPITDTALLHLRHVPNLKYLDLSNTGITDAGLVHLKELENLEDLRLSGTRVTDTGLIHLKQFKHLKNLMLEDTRVTDAGLVHLHHLPELEWLCLDRTDITDAGLAEMHRLKNLRKLNVRGTAITDDGLKHLEKLPQLEFLRTEDTRCTQEGRDRLWDALPSREVH